MPRNGGTIRVWGPAARRAQPLARPARARSMPAAAQSAAEEHPRPPEGQPPQPAEDQPRIEVDLRKRIDPDVVELLLMRAGLLAPEDAALLEAYFRRGVGALELGRLAGVTPRQIRFRIRRLAQRVFDPGFCYVMRHRDLWGPTRREIAESIYIKGLSRRETARTMGLSLHVVRRHALAIAERIELETSGAPASPGGGRR